MTYRRVAQVAVRHFRSLIPYIPRTCYSKRTNTLELLFRRKGKFCFIFFFSSEFFVVHMLRFESVDVLCCEL